MKQIYLIFMLFLGGKLFAQVPDFCPSGAKWYHVKTDMQSTESYFQYVFNKDTIVNNQLCKKVIKQSVNWETPHFIFQKDDSIFGLENAKWSLLFRINLNIGEVLKLSRGFQDSVSLLVDSVHYVNTPLPTKIFYLSTIGGWDNKIIIYDRFGLVRGLFGKNFIDVFDQGSFGLCYEDDNQPLYQFTNSACVASTEDENDVNKIKLSPNPAYDVLNIDLQGNDIEKLQIFNQFGQIQLESTDFSNTSFNIVDWNSGVYILKVKYRNSEIMAAKRFIKI
jgi:hypothetical protein